MRTPYRIAALSALALLTWSVTEARTTYIRVRLVDLVRSNTVMIVTPKVIGAALQREDSVRTTWHVFEIEERLSRRSDGQFAGMGRQSCGKAAPGIVTGKNELAMPFVDVDRSLLTATQNQLFSDIEAGSPTILPEMGRRYLLMAADCGDGTSRFPLGSNSGLFEIDAAGNLTASGRPPVDFEQASVATIRELIADLARYDADVSPTGLVVGQVVDAVTNQPVADAQVELAGVDEREVRSSEDGWFVFRDVRAFTYSMAVTGYGWITTKHRVSVVAGERRTNLSIPFHRQPAIHGVLREENGRPIPMVWLNAAPVAGDAVTPNGTFRQTRTDDRGRFSFDALGPGNYVVHAPISPLQGVEPDERPGVTFYPSTFHATGNAQVNGDVVSIRADEGSRQADIVVRQIPMRRVTGAVVRGSAPSKEAHIRVSRVDSVAERPEVAKLAVRAARTRPDGTFQMSDLAPGEYLFELSELGGPAFQAHVDLTRGDVTGLTFDLRAMTVARRAAESGITAASTASIEGVVIDANAPDASGLSRTRVTATNVATRAVRRVQTDPNGSFHIGRLPAGRYELLADRDGFLPVTPGNPVHLPPVVTVDADGVASATLTMRQASVVTGTVYDQSGAPVAGYWVTLRRLRPTTGPPVMHDLLNEFRRKDIGGVHNSGSTDSDGRYRIFGVPPGDYVVAAKFEGNLPTSRRTTREEVERALADARRTTDSSLPGPVADSRAPVPSSPPAALASSVRLPVYHPSTLDPLSAASVRVEAGVELAGVDIVVIDAAPVPVSGMVRVDGVDTDGIELLFERVDVAGENAQAAYLQPDRTFTQREIAPGRYVVFARTRPASGGRSIPMSGRTVIDVQAAVEDMVVTLRPAGVVSGRLVVPPDAVNGNPFTFVRLEPERQGDGDPGPSVRASGDGTFTLHGVPPGRYRIRTEPGTSDAQPWAVQGLGVNGVQSTDDVIEVAEGTTIGDLLVQLRTVE